MSVAVALPRERCPQRVVFSMPRMLNNFVSIDGRALIDR
jgi:hypothetical protein